MAIELKEYVGAVALQTKANDNKVNLTEGYTQTYIDDESLMVDIEGIHSIITRNDTLYTPECIKDSIPYWTAPYERPVIMHHNEKDGKIIGRVKAANYIETSERSNTAALELIANIGDEEGKKGIKNGTLATVSIGAIAHDIRCSICGTNLVEEGMCEHDKGEVYDNKRCYWIVNKIEPKEVSYVIVPSDIYAHNTRVYEAVKKNKNEVKESMSTNIFADLIEAHGLNATESAEEKETKVTETAEGTQVDEEVKDGAKVNKGEEVKEPKSEEAVTEESKEEEAAKKEEEPKETEPKKQDSNEGEKEGEATTEEKKEDEPKAEENNKEAKESEEKEEDNKALEEAKKEIAELKAQVNALTAEKAKLLKQVESEKALKESAEMELVTFRAERKKALVESVKELRAKLNLPEQDAAVLMESTEEALNLTINSLNEFVEVQNKTFAGITMVESPVAVSEEKDNTSKEKVKIENVKESLEDSNSDLEQGLLSILERCF